jgi:N-acetylmuramoyl-L-alanine amidase
MKIQNHRLSGTGISFVASPNHGSKFQASLPDTLVIHFTAGASLSSSVRSLCDPASKASAHVVVGREAAMVQLVPFDVIAWHAGASTLGARTGLNKYSIGIEIDNAGRLTQTAAGDFVTWFGRRVQKKDAIQGKHRNETSLSWWHTYTQRQIELVFELSALLAQKYPIRTIVGHEEISPGRKSDPGPAFPLERLRDRILGPGRQEDAAAA